MAFVDATVLLDFVSSLAVLGLLVLGFSALAPALRSGWYIASGLGVFFGLVAGLQMSMPLSPIEGVIVDMRNVPVVLAGAFLGLRGLAVCLCLTIAFRIGIGGVGVPAGIIGTMIAGAVGYGWAQVKDRLHMGDAAKLCGLGLTMNLHMLSAFAVPPDIMKWYFMAAAPTIFALNIICVPALGWLLLREQKLVARNTDLSASARVDPVTRLLPLNAFSQEVAHFNAADDDNQMVGIVAVTLKNVPWIKRTWGEDAVAQALGVTRHRIHDALRDERPLGTDSFGRVLVPITASEMADQRRMRHIVRRAISENHLMLGGNVRVLLTALVESFALRDADSTDQILKDIKRSAAARRPQSARADNTQTPARHPSEAPLPKGLCQRTYHRLFDETDAKIQRALRQS